MLLDGFVTIKIVNNNIREYYSQRGYDVSSYNVVVSVEHLLKNSHVLVNVRCDVCGNEKKLKFLKYNKNISKYNIYTCNNSCAQVKNKLTSINNFGTDHYSKTDIHRSNVSKINKGIDISKYEYRECFICKSKFNIRKLHKKITCSKSCFKVMQQDPNYKNMVLEKTQNSLMLKYGVMNQYQRKDVIDKLRVQRVLNGLEIPEIDLSDWNKYKRIVNRLTRRNKKKLFDNWNGFDYYDKEFILHNLKLKHTNNNYPTIDHKVSVFFGFKNKIPAEELSDIKNLCITKRIINVLKRTKNEDEFLEVDN